MNPRTPTLRAVLVSAPLLSVAALWAQTAKTAVPPSAAGQPKAFVAAPGPDAEYLSLADRYTLGAGGSVVHERRSRLQVNSYVAINRKWGESKVPFDPAIEKLEVLANRTVLPSGRIVEAPANAIVDDQPPGADHDPLWSGLRRRVIVHTALEPGAVIEESWRVTTSGAAAPWLELAEPLALEPPIRSRVIEVDLPTGTPLQWQAVGWLTVEPKRETVSGRDVWRWSLDNVAPFPPEPGAPPEPPAIVASSCRDRTALEQEFERRAGTAGGLEDVIELARETARKNPGKELCVLAVFDAITDRLRVAPVNPSEQHWRPRPLAQVWRSGVATPLELAAVEAQALRAAGFQASPAVASANPGRNLDRCPAFAALNRAIVVVAWGDEEARVYDPQNAALGGPLEAPTLGDRLVASPPSTGAPLRWLQCLQATLKLTGEIASDGTVKGTLEFQAAGGATPHAALVRDPAKFARDLALVVPDGKASNVRVTELRRDSASLVAEIEGKLPQRTPLGFIPWTFGETPGGVESRFPPPPSPGRQAPIALPETCDLALEVTFTLPKGWSVAALPSTSAVGNDTGTVTTGGLVRPDGVVRLWRRINLRRSMVPAAESEQVRALLTAWLSPAGRELLLRPTEAGASTHAP